MPKPVTGSAVPFEIVIAEDNSPDAMLVREGLERVAKFGADAYFRKPSEFDAFLTLGNVIKTLFSN